LQLSADAKLKGVDGVELVVTLHLDKNLTRNGSIEAIQVRRRSDDRAAGDATTLYGPAPRASRHNGL
jgi:hypothetical protein